MCPDVSPSACIHTCMFGQVYSILDEVVLGGMVLETSLSEITMHAEAQAKLEKAEVLQPPLPPFPPVIFFRTCAPHLLTTLFFVPCP